MTDVRTSSLATASLPTSRHFRTGFALAARAAAAAVFALLIGATAAQAETLRGRVVDPEGRVVPGARVTISGVTAAPIAVVADATGAFRVDDLPAGASVEVNAWAPGLAAPPTRLQVSEAEVELRLAVSAVDESLTVTASYVDTPLSLLGDSVSIFTRADLDARQITTLGDALRLVPGFTVARNGGPGSVTSVFTRGGESDYTMVLVDGVRMNGFGGGLDLSQVAIDGAERVEMVRGPQSALYGSDAIGGVVQVLTSRNGDPRVDALIEGGGREARRAAGSARGSLGGVVGTLSGQYMEDEGYTGVAPADGSTVSNDDSRISDASLGLGWRGNAGTDLFGTFQYLDSDRGSPGPYGSNPAGNFSGVDRNARSLTWRRAGAVRLLQPLGGAASRVRLRAEADVADFDLEYRDEFGSTGETSRGHGRLQADAALTATLSGSAGGEWVGESGRSTYIVSPTGEVPVDRDVWAGFAEARWQPTARLSLTGGARASRITRAALPANPDGFPPRPAFDDETINAVNPKATAAWTVVPEGGASGTSTKLHAAAGTGIRPPDAFEIAFTDNDGLKPERSTSYEAGVTQTFFAGAMSADATWFHNSYDDLIISVGRFSSSSRYTTDNIANARARGAELGLTVRPGARFNVRGTYTFLDSEILAVDGTDGEAPSPFVVGDPLLRRPRHQGSVDAVWSAGGVSLFTSAVFRGETLDVEPNFGTFGGLYENDGYTVVNVGGSWTILRRMTLFGRLVNAFDEAYEDTLGYPALGRTAYVGLRIAAGR
jgi:outer membrane cobalamin receptor